MEEREQDTDFEYFFSRDSKAPVSRNAFLQDFVVDRMSDLGGEIISGKMFSVGDIAFCIAGDVVRYSAKTGDRVLNAKAKLLSCWLDSKYAKDDSIIDTIDKFESIESMIYSGMNEVLKAEDGN
ncbi:hypothetical protein JW851_00170 [Candidatus Woesearchaeota archaeon]|nr:hypothetical protein [Candidatus Woesearchaeota archaeon]